MKTFAFLLCLIVVGSHASPLEQERSDVVAKLHEILAELEGEDSSKSDGSELMEEVDISDMNLDDFKESGDEFILDSDKTADLLAEFREAMANQGEVSDDEKNDVILMRDVPDQSQEDTFMTADSDSDKNDDAEINENDDADTNDNDDEDSSKSDGAELMAEVDISDMNLDDFKESGDEFILDSDKTADLLDEFRQAMANQGEVSDDEKDDVILMRDVKAADEAETELMEGADAAEESSKSDGAELMAEVDISDMNLDDFKESGDEFILDSDKTADLLEEFRQAMANQGEVSDDEKNDIILMRDVPRPPPRADAGDEAQMESMEDEEVNELNLDSGEQTRSARIADFEEENHAETANAAYPENPDSFVSEVLSDLNSEE